MADRLEQLPSGRRVGVTGLGDPMAERLVLLCHPTPGAAGFDPAPSVTARRGVHLITFDRPGYGSSDQLPLSVLPSLERQADDLATLIHRFETIRAEITPASQMTIGVIGWGTGGLVAATLATRHPTLVDRLALVATPAPIPRRRRRLKHLERDTVLGSLGILADDPYLQRPGLRGRLERMVRDAGNQHGAGERADREARAETIDADRIASLSEISATTLLVVGTRDERSGPSDARWYRHRIPDARTLRCPDTGPLAIVARWPAIVNHVGPHHERKLLGRRASQPSTLV